MRATLGGAKMPKMTNEEALALAQRSSAGDMNAQERLINGYMPLVFSVASRYANKFNPFPDLVQEGSIGLTRSVATFDYTKGIKFITYATMWIRQAINQAITETARPVRLPGYQDEKIPAILKAIDRLIQELCRYPRAEEIAYETGNSTQDVEDILRVSCGLVSLDERIGVRHEQGETRVDHIPAEEDAIDLNRIAMQDIAQKIKENGFPILNSDERQVIELRFGIPDGNGKTLQEVGDIMKVTRERVRQIEKKALKKLLCFCKRNGLHDGFLNE